MRKNEVQHTKLVKWSLFFQVRLPYVAASWLQCKATPPPMPRDAFVLRAISLDRAESCASFYPPAHVQGYDIVASGIWNRTLQSLMPGLYSVDAYVASATAKNNKCHYINLVKTAMIQQNSVSTYCIAERKLTAFGEVFQVQLSFLAAFLRLGPKFL